MGVKVVLALHFIDPGDYDRIQESDRLSIAGLTTFTPGVPLQVTFRNWGLGRRTREKTYFGSATLSEKWGVYPPPFLGNTSLLQNQSREVFQWTDNR